MSISAPLNSKAMKGMEKPLLHHTLPRIFQSWSSASSCFCSFAHLLLVSSPHDFTLGRQYLLLGGVFQDIGAGLNFTAIVSSSKVLRVRYADSSPAFSNISFFNMDTKDSGYARQIQALSVVSNVSCCMIFGAPTPRARKSKCNLKMPVDCLDFIMI